MTATKSKNIERLLWMEATMSEVLNWAEANGNPVNAQLIEKYLLSRLAAH